MPEPKPSPGVELAEFAAAIVIAAVVDTGAYLLADRLPFLVTLTRVVIVAFGAAALVFAGIARREARR